MMGWLMRSMTELGSRKWISRMTGRLAQSTVQPGVYTFTLHGKLIPGKKVRMGESLDTLRLPNPD
ncbi:hypothetical protein [Paenibacillus senegalensis]|uniref:hypothetical protein n=1 Tax=Paenibacillus senegalensis TaxID=1465766 RepID=UPI000474BDA3|nr:hypothetical protein [Paenibacillus senegalensis]